MTVYGTGANANTSLQGFFAVLYVGGAWPARPTEAIVPAGRVQFVGPTQPSDMLTKDVWLRTDS